MEGDGLRSGGVHAGHSNYSPARFALVAFGFRFIIRTRQHFPASAADLIHIVPRFPRSPPNGHAPLFGRKEAIPFSHDATPIPPPLRLTIWALDTHRFKASAKFTA
jgi:hypothetical protein